MDQLDLAPDSYSEASSNNYGETIHARRGWWDYVPGSEKPAPAGQGRAVSMSHASGFFYVLRTAIGRLWRSEDSNIAVARKSSIHSESPLPQPSRPIVPENPEPLASHSNETSRSRSPVPSFSSHHIGLRPRMVLLREVMRDEVRSIVDRPFTS